jgi:hypothetical protein
MSEFSQLGESQTFAETLRAAQIGGSSGEKVDLTPEHMRALMKKWIDPLDALFDKHRLLLYQTMELNAQQNLFEAEYSVQDDETADEMRLSLLFQRLVKWAQRKGFAVRTSGRSLRSFIVSWDPLATPESITPQEREDKRSVAVRRMRAYQNTQQDLNRSFSPSHRQTFADSIIRNAVGFVQEPLKNLVSTLEEQQRYQSNLHANSQTGMQRSVNYQQQSGIDEMAELLAPPIGHHRAGKKAIGSAAALDAHDLQRAKNTANRAARVAGGESDAHLAEKSPSSQSE